PGRRLPQALHQYGIAVGADGAHGRLARSPCGGGSQRRLHHPHPRRRRQHPGASRRRGAAGSPAATGSPTMTDQVFVSGLALHAYHGVMQHEAKVGQTFKLDLMLDLDLTQASRSDKLADTVGYDQVVDVASEAFCAKRYRLIEAAAGAVAEAV